MKILIAYDGSASSIEAVKSLRTAGLPKKTQAMVLTAADVLLTPQMKAMTPAAVRARKRAEQALRAAQRTAKNGAQSLKKLFPRWKIKPIAVADSPGWAIIKTSESTGTHLIVMGAKGTTPLTRFLGSVSQMVIGQARCPVRIGRRSRLVNKRPRIVIAATGNRELRKILKHLNKRKWSPAPEIEALTVKNGDPKRLIADAAKKHRADCIFLGARKIWPLRRLIQGGVSMSTAAYADCSVEILK